MNKLILTKVTDDFTLPKHIIVAAQKDGEIATIYCDQTFNFNEGRDYSLDEIKQLTTIAENFNLFYNNL